MVTKSNLLLSRRVLIVVLLLLLLGLPCLYVAVQMIGRQRAAAAAPIVGTWMCREKRFLTACNSR